LVRRILPERIAHRRQAQGIEEFIDAEPGDQQGVSEKEAFSVLGWTGEPIQPAEREMRGGEDVLALAPSVYRPS